MNENLIEIISDQMELGLNETLILDGIQVTQFDQLLKKEIEKYPKIRVISLVNCNLRNLANFPQLPNLEILELDKNPFDPI